MILRGLLYISIAIASIAVTSGRWPPLQRPTPPESHVVTIIIMVVMIITPGTTETLLVSAVLLCSAACAVVAKRDDACATFSQPIAETDRRR